MGYSKNINWWDRISSIRFYFNDHPRSQRHEMRVGEVFVFPEFMACYRKVWLIGIYLCLYTPFESKMFNENRPQFWMMRWKHLFFNGRLGISGIIDIVKPSFRGRPIKTSRPEKKNAVKRDHVNVTIIGKMMVLLGWYSYIINPRYTPYIVGIYWVYPLLKGSNRGVKQLGPPIPRVPPFCLWCRSPPNIPRTLDT